MYSSRVAKPNQKVCGCQCDALPTGASALRPSPPWGCPLDTAGQREREKKKIISRKEVDRGHRKDGGVRQTPGAVASHASRGRSLKISDKVGFLIREPGNVRLGGGCV